MRTSPRRTSVCSVDEGRSRAATRPAATLRRTPPAPPESPAAFGQRGQPRLGNQHRKPLRAPRIALRGRRLARNPLLAHQRRPAPAAWPPSPCAAWRPSPARPIRQPRKHPPLHVLLFRESLPRAFAALVPRELTLSGRLGNWVNFQVLDPKPDLSVGFRYRNAQPFPQPLGLEIPDPLHPGSASTSRPRSVMR
jgi:hypothetical protein